MPSSAIQIKNTLSPEQRARKAALSSFVGAVVDWYDFLLYGIVAALIFKDQFFPSIGNNMGTLAALATFGVGFLFRPLGGVVFGHFGDKLGRKKMLVLTVILMGISTVGIGLLPNFEAIGWWAFRGLHDGRVRLSSRPSDDRPCRISWRCMARRSPG